MKTSIENTITKTNRIYTCHGYCILSSCICKTFLAFLLVESKIKASLLWVSLFTQNLNCRPTEAVESESEVGLGSCIEPSSKSTEVVESESEEGLGISIIKDVSTFLMLSWA